MIEMIVQHAERLHERLLFRGETAIRLEGQFVMHSNMGTSNSLEDGTIQTGCGLRSRTVDSYSAGFKHTVESTVSTACAGNSGERDRSGEHTNYTCRPPLQGEASEKKRRKNKKELGIPKAFLVPTNLQRSLPLSCSKQPRRSGIAAGHRLPMLGASISPLHLAPGRALI